jgi:hypothetical protein
VSILYRRTTVAAGLIGGAVLVLVVVLLAVFGGDRRTRVAVAVAGALAALVWILPLALGIVSHSHDYFLSRNVMPSVVPLAVAIGAACAAPRLRLVGGALALALLVLFAIGAIRVQSRPWFHRPDWRGVAAALGPATVPRAILAANGTTADPLKIYLPGVHWSEPPGSRRLIREVDVVGAIKRLPLVAGRPTDFRGVKRPTALRDVKLPPAVGGVTRPTGLRGVGERATSLRGVRRRRAGPMGRPVPTVRAPRGMRLIARFRFHNWVLARFALQRPLRVTSRQLAALAPRVFRRVPVALLAFFQAAQR